MYDVNIELSRDDMENGAVDKVLAIVNQFDPEIKIGSYKRYIDGRSHRGGELHFASDKVKLIIKVPTPSTSTDMYELKQAHHSIKTSDDGAISYEMSTSGYHLMSALARFGLNEELRRKLAEYKGDDDRKSLSLNKFLHFCDDGFEVPAKGKDLEMLGMLIKRRTHNSVFVMVTWEYTIGDTDYEFKMEIKSSPSFKDLVFNLVGTTKQKDVTTITTLVADLQDKKIAMFEGEVKWRGDRKGMGILFPSFPGYY
jgi:hypothetical protein